MQTLLKFLNDDSGPTAVEYAVMLALIILTCFTAIAAVGTSTNTMWNDLIKGGLDKI
ncbi:MAG: Flp family type IVb pilin [Planctomycetaceae bacterium]